MFEKVEKMLIICSIVLLLVVTTFMFQETRLHDIKETTKQETIKNVCKDMAKDSVDSDRYGECIIRNSVVN